MQSSMNQDTKVTLRSKLRLKRNNSNRIPEENNQQSSHKENVSCPNHQDNLTDLKSMKDGTVNKKTSERGKLTLEEYASCPITEDSLADFKSPQKKTAKETASDNFKSPTKEYPSTSNTKDELQDFKSSKRNATTETIPEKTSSRKKNPSSSYTEDSLADFKSPKEEAVKKPIFYKFKNNADKVKKKLTSKSKSSSKARKSLSDANQPSIESSFFKPQTTNENELKESFPCPLCLKVSKDEISCTNHMKICAAKNKVSLQQLLLAKQLQERQAEERKAMGLVGAPILQEKKKVFRSKNFSTKDDPQLQLALALSNSLYHAEQMEELEQAALLAGIPSECIKDMSEEDRKITLQNFGFTTNKPVEEGPSIKPRKKRLIGPTILQTRSKEDKDRVLTERIACILTADDAFTQIPENTKIICQESTPTLIKSQILKEIRVAGNSLWDKSRLTKKINNFYVEELKLHFLQSNEQRSTELNISELLHSNNNEHSVSNSSIEYEPMEIDLIINHNKQLKTSDEVEKSKAGNMNCEIDFMKNTILNWKEALNDSAASDIIIFVKNEHIYAHKLVLHVQCSNILLHIEPNDTESQPRIQEKILWPDKDQLSALAFLEFLYSGTITKYIHVFDKPDMVNQIEQLSRLYRVQDLFTYLKLKQNEIQTNNVNVDENTTLDENHGSNENYFQNLNLARDEKIQKSVSLYDKQSDSEIQLTKLRSGITRSHTDSSLNVQRSSMNNRLSNISFVNDSRRMTTSPDLFESENEEDICMDEMNSQTEDNSNLKLLVNLIEDDENSIEHDISMQNTPIYLSEEDPNRIDLADSQKTVANSSRTPSPSNGGLSIKTTQKNIHEVVTPIKGISSETRDVLNLQTNNENIYEVKMSEAITPEYTASSKLNDYVTPNTVYTDILLNQSMSGNNSIHNDKTPPRKEISKNDYNSISTAVTPPKPLSTESYSKSEKTVQKSKTDLSLFIERVKRINARSILDSDSEVDTPVINKKRRNPFLKKNQDDSYESSNDGSICRRNRKVISLLEEDVIAEEKRLFELNQLKIKCRENFHSNKSTEVEHESFSCSLSHSENLNSPQNESIKIDSSQIVKTREISVSKSQKIDSPHETISTSSIENDSKRVLDPVNCNEELEDITVDEALMSMYSKYKKSNRLNNSIEKYRNELNLDINWKSSKTVFFDATDDNITNAKSVSMKNNPGRKRNIVSEDITLVSDSDDEKLENSDIFQFRNETCNNDSVNKSKEKESPSNSDVQNLEDDSLSPFNHIEPPQVSNTKNSNASKNEVNNELIDLSQDSDEENNCNNSYFPSALASNSNNSVEKEKCVRENQHSQDKEQNKISKNLDEVDAEINQILQSSPEVSNKRNNSPEKYKKAVNQGTYSETTDEIGKKIPNVEHEVINLSPISLISSPEICKFNEENHIQSNEKESQIFTKLKGGRSKVLDSTDDECFEDININNDWSRKTPDTVEIHKSHLNELNEDESGFSMSKKRLSFDDPSEDGNLSKSYSVTPKASGSQKLQSSPLKISPILSQNRRNLRISHSFMKTVEINESPEHSPESKKLKTKSDFDKNCSQKSSILVTPKHNRLHPDEDIVTPPLDYSSLETPELRKELDRFGIKPLNRNKAKLLLRHIYKETHPVTTVSQKRASSSNPSSEDEGPPLKKVTRKKSKTVNKQTCPTVAEEEMDLDEPITINEQESAVSIKDAFLRLIKNNKELHNKVLTYEPLPLESLHSQLKLDGLKCKVNALMDFLDEQCITFQVQSGKGSRVKKKK